MQKRKDRKFCITANDTHNSIIFTKTKSHQLDCYD